MTILTSQMSLLLIMLLSITFHKSMSSNNTLVQCNEKDREILLTFRKGINDSYGEISNWSTEKDCCSWEGVLCDNITNRVTKLDLNFNLLEGEINLCILELEFLSYLDLSENHFDVISIPTIQNNITHASNLLHLDLDDRFGVLQMDNLDWLSPLSSLKFLNLSYIDLHKVTNWLQVVTSLPSLSDLRLNYCKLNNFMIKPSLEYVYFTSSLVTLYLYGNNFSSHLPNEFFNLTKDLSDLGLSSSNIHGEIPSSLQNLRNLRYLDLSSNKLQGSIPDGIGQLQHIQTLYLSENMLSGSIPSTIGNLSSLIDLSIGSNNFSGEISKITFAKLSKLDFLDLSYSNFAFQFDLDWVPPFQLHLLYLSNTNQGPNFPSWIYTQKSLQALDLSSSRISMVDRNRFLSLIEGISGIFHLSNNSITENISNLTLKGTFIDLHRNNFTGGIPHLSSNAIYVDLSCNSFSGSIPISWKNMINLEYIDLWSNRLSGEVLVQLFNLEKLQVINIGENEFSGTIPIEMSKKLEVIILRANQFEGKIPPQLFKLPSLYHLDLAHNKLLGSIPKNNYNLTQMVTFNVQSWFPDKINLFTKGQNYVYDTNPYRRTIDLSANSLSGEISSELFRLVQVQTLNLSHNNLIGTIPKTIGGMKNIESLDLSNNKFCGEIPESMALLTFLDYLNLSNNNFHGKIPISTQLQSFNASSYIGNPKLCGAPLNNCTTDKEHPKNATSSRWKEDGDSFKESLYLGMGVGFAVGFWGICGSLFLIRKWRHTCFWFFDGVVDKMYVTLMVKLNSFHKKGAPSAT